MENSEYSVFKFIFIFCNNFEESWISLPGIFLGYNDINSISYKIYDTSNENLFNATNENLNIQGKIYNNNKINEKIYNLNNNEFQKVRNQIELNKELNINLNKDYLYLNDQINLNY